MNTLLYPSLAPLTFRIGFLNCSLPKVREAFLEWKPQHLRSIASRDMSLPLEKALLELQPLSVPPRRWLFVQTESGWTAYFDNGIRGADPVSVIGFLAGRLGSRGAIATSIPHTLSTDTGRKPGLYGATQFELFSPHRTAFLNYERTISVAYDSGKWLFEANGAVQPFEQTAKYSQRRIIDRFTIEMLKLYCSALGIDVATPSFYQPCSTLVWSDDPLPIEHVIQTVSQAQERMGVRAFSTSG
ncbi:MAG: hypothetical protein C5B50_11860 [Verrucomicrobia bacterium]|nr:MAG: hypothetical protein C5B50_11860 [Verrucomicrobiota bacterium]